MAIFKPQQSILKDGTQVILRSATESDTGELLSTIREYILENEGMVWEPNEYQKTIEEMKNWIKGLAENANEILILAIIDGKIVGNIDLHAGARRRIAHVGEFGMGLLPEVRSRGLGSILLNCMFSWITEHNCFEKINLRVLSTNRRAIDLYKKFGFYEEGRRIKEFRFEDGTYVDDVMMTKFLHASKN